jgi:hypothetical protein
LLVGTTSTTGLTGGFGLRIASTTAATSSIAGAAVFGDAATAATNVSIGGGKVYTGDTTDATAIGTASVVIAGGLSVGKRLILDGASGKTLRIANVVANAAVAVTFTGVGPTGSTAGPPQGWMRIDANGTDRYTPFW